MVPSSDFTPVFIFFFLFFLSSSFVVSLSCFLDFFLILDLEFLIDLRDLPSNNLIFGLKTFAQI